MSATDPADLEASLQAAAAAIRAADAILIGAGAGMGVDSGLPDFRGNEGFWRAYPPLKKLELSFVKMANPYWFHHDPEQAWGFYGHRRNLYRATEPHAGFQILSKWCQRASAGWFVFTSNVDGHFQRAGFAAEQIVECHGSLEFLQCLRFCTLDIWPAEREAIDIDESTFRARPPLPACRQCGRLARPNVLMFDDADWLEQRTSQQHRRLITWRHEIRRSRQVVLEFGAGLAVPTVRYECEAAGGTLIRINPREPQTPAGAISLPLGALDAITRLDALLR